MGDRRSYQLSVTREYTNPRGTRHRILSKAAEETRKVALNRNFLQNVRFHHHPHSTHLLYQKNGLGETFFKQVKVAPPSMSVAVKRFAQNPNPKPVDNPLEKLIEVIEGDWDSEKFHVHFHSCGYDSRIISGILMKLKEKHGEGWLGDILFICLEPEGALFKKIMKWEGWKPNQYYVYREGVGIDYRSEVVEFKKAWRWVNDYAVPYGCLGPAVAKAKRIGRIPKARDVSMIHGSGTWQFSPATKPLKPRFTYPNQLVTLALTRRECSATYSMMSAIPYDEYYIPFLDIRLMASVNTLELEPPLKRDWLRAHLLRELSRELYELPRLPHHSGYREPNWIMVPGGLSEKTRVKAAKNYNGSWYARETGQPKIHIAPDLNHGITREQAKWWRNYALASTCEHLIKQGVKITL